MKDTLHKVGREIMDFGRLVDKNDRGDIRAVKTQAGFEIQWVKIGGV